MKGKIIMRRIVLLAAVALLAVAAIAPAAVAAEEGNFDLTVKHRINGNPLGLDRQLPVDVYVDGGLAIEDFMLSDTVKTQLPAGDYYIEVKLANTETVVLDLQTGEVPEGANVEIIAKRFGQDIGLKVKVK
jgi:hypothetical protein